ncbi:MAG: orotate phosphoribosyltransferase [Candidatus Obscuribacterales bacterium]|nr:orotate phosphoribosyltransferase [Candidatus Obscuribacterales bacterium]
MSNNIETLLKSVDAIQTGHFLLSSGLHSDHYMQCQKIMQFPRHGATLADEMAKKIMAAGITPDAVVGPALGAVHWEVFMASALDKLSSSMVRAIFAERADGTEFQIRRGIEIKPKEKIIVVEDVTTTGGSAMKVVDLVRKLGGEPLAVATIIDRSGGKIDFGIPFFSLLTAQLQTFDPADCPMCKEGSPVVKPGTTKHKT